MDLTPDGKLLEDIANWVFPGLTLYYRDADLTPEQLSKYKQTIILRNSFFIDLSSLGEGISGNTRFLIASAHALSMSELNPDREELAVWHAFIINGNSYFKIIDVLNDSGKTQITLLHIPKRWVTLQAEHPFTLNLEQTIIDTARRRFAEKTHLQPAQALQNAEWHDRTKYPIGLDSENQLSTLDRSSELDSIPLYGALKKVLNDTSGLD